MQISVLNKQGNFGVKILWRYTDMAIFVLRCFILTHPVQAEQTGNAAKTVIVNNPTVLCFDAPSPRNPSEYPHIPYISGN